MSSIWAHPKYGKSASFNPLSFNLYDLQESMADDMMVAIMRRYNLPALDAIAIGCYALAMFIKPLISALMGSKGG